MSEKLQFEQLVLILESEKPYENLKKLRGANKYVFYSQDDSLVFFGALFNISRNQESIVLHQRSISVSTFDGFVTPHFDVQTLPTETFKIYLLTPSLKNVFSNYLEF